MKKYGLLTLLVALLPTITACQDNAHSVVALNISGGRPLRLEINKQQFDNLIKSNQQFAIEFYSPYCGHCEDLASILDEVVSKTGHLIYSLDMSTYEREEIEALQEKYPTVFPDLYVPAIRYIKNAALTYEVSSKKFSSSTALRSIMEKHYIKSGISLFQDSIYFNDYMKSFETPTECYVISYDLNNVDALKFVSEKIITRGTALNHRNYALLNKTSANLADTFEIIKTQQSIDYDTFILKVEAHGSIGTIKETANYLDDGFSYEDFLS